jgi:hypothetical protein
MVQNMAALYVDAMVQNMAALSHVCRNLQNMAEMYANRTHPRRSARLTTALKAAGATRPHPSPWQNTFIVIEKKI